MFKVTLARPFGALASHWPTTRKPVTYIDIVIDIVIKILWTAELTSKIIIKLLLLFDFNKASDLCY